MVAIAVENKCKVRSKRCSPRVDGLFFSFLGCTALVYRRTLLSSEDARMQFSSCAPAGAGHSTVVPSTQAYIKRRQMSHCNPVSVQQLRFADNHLKSCKEMKKTEWNLLGALPCAAACFANCSNTCASLESGGRFSSPAVSSPPRNKNTCQLQVAA